MGFIGFCRNIHRKKSLNENLLATELKRCLGIFDLSLLGISGMLGAGIYVLTGAVAKDISGPAVPISYLLAAFAAFLSALCYAEFGARIPSTGSSYIFTYITMGEMWGFLMGWNMILEHGVGSASVAKAWSGYLDSVLGYPMKTYLEHHVAMGDGVILAKYPDFLAASIILLLSVLVACGVSSSNKFNITFAILNICVVLFIISTGFFLADIKNWTDVEGGFAPFGFAGIVAGASRCFYAYAGFDVVASSCEEAKNPKRDIPIALAVSLIIVTVAYFGISSMLTLMVPWNEIVPKSAFPDAYGRHDGWKWAQIVVTLGALCTMTSSMFSGLFVLPRIMYAIAKDGLLCRCLSSVNEKTQVPTYSVIFAATLSGLMALLFDLETLVQFMSIGTLTAYSFVAACVIILRYSSLGKINAGYEAFENSPATDEEREIKSSPTTSQPRLSETSRLVYHKSKEESVKVCNTSEGNREDSCKQTNSTSSEDNTAGMLKMNFLGTWLDTYFGRFQPGKVVLVSLLVAVVFSLAGMILISHTWREILSGLWWPILLLIIFTLTAVTSLLLICAHQQFKGEALEKEYFKVPLVPFIPYLCICTNLFFMIKLQWLTWIRLLIWVTMGLIIYLAYGYHFSQQNPNRSEPHWSEAIRCKINSNCLLSKFKRSDDSERLTKKDNFEGIKTDNS